MNRNLRVIIFLALAFLVIQAFPASSASSTLVLEAKRHPELVEESPPAPMPHDCDGFTPPGEVLPVCCISGYIYYNDAPVAPAGIQIESLYGTLSVSTAVGPFSDAPYYVADLSAEPLLVSPGDVISITASYNGMVSTRAWTVQSGGQQVDLGLIVGYQAALPVFFLAADALDSAALQALPWRAAAQENIRWQEYQAYLPDLLVDGFVAAPGEQRTDQGVSYPERGIASSLLTDKPFSAISRAGILSVVSNSHIFTDTHVITISSHTSRTFDLPFGDADGDGYLDLALGNHDLNQMCWNNGDYTFDCEEAFGGSATFDVDWGDMDGDGYLDLVVANQFGHPNLVCLNNGDHTFTCASFSKCPNDGGICHTALADVDGDDDLDIALGIRFTQDLIYYNDGTGTFPITATACYDAWTWTLDMEFGDVDDDDDPDLVVVGNGFDYVCINDGGSFTETRHLDNPNTWSVALDDVDGDGDLDIAMGNDAGAPIDIYLNDGHGYFVETLSIGSASDYIPDLAWGDIDNDGDPDLAAAINGRPNVVYFNDAVTATGSITFTRKISFGLFLTPTNSVSFGDVDSDGDLNLAAGNDGVENVIYINTLVVPLTDVDIVGPTTGIVSTTHTFTAAVSPLTATLPITYVWQAAGQSSVTNTGGLSDEVTFHWPTTGTQTITVTATNAGGAVSDIHVITLYILLDAAFTASPLTGVTPLTVTFTDQSIGEITSWSWNFDDGGTSDAQNPTHVYTSTGSFTVTLTISGPGGSDDETKVAYITVGYPAPNAAFSAAPLTGTAPFDVQFTDQSSGDVIAWSWNFGDGGVSGARHPLHRYTYPGPYTVTLTVTGPGGSDTATKSGYIIVNPAVSSPPIASISYIWPDPAVQGQDTVYFNGSCHDTDQGGAFIVAYEWRCSLDGRLSGQEDFHLSASELAVGTSTCSFKCQDNEGQWSQEVTRTLTVQANPQQETRTLILVNRQKLETLYGDVDAAQVMDKLDALAAHSSVQGVVVQVEDDAAVSAAYTAWDADPTSTARANAVTEAIKALVDGRWATYPDLEYLVIVGDDRVIPFRRVLDQTWYSERHYRRVSITSTVGAALHDDMTLTDDYYADAAPTVPDAPRWDGHDLYLPDLGVGRLIETPGEIVAQIDAFLADDEIAASNALVSGYGFVSDGAQAMCYALSDDGLATDCTLIGYNWGAADLLSKVFNTRHDVVSINGHAHHYATCTPVGCVHSSDIVGATADHARTAFYTLGCHSGLNVPPTNPYESLDTAQALVQHQTNYIANTGYGWGYIFSVGLSEQLMLDFTERLVYGQSATLGQALAAAKQEYYLNESRFDYYDEKILIESTLYGLPMYRYNTPAAATRQQPEPQATVVQKQMSVLGGGLTVNTHSYQFPALLAENTSDGTYYSFGGQTHGGDGEPIQPKYTADLSFPGTQAHGIVYKGGVFTDVLSYDPIIERAITETATLAEPDFDALGWYPAQIQRLNRLERGDRLVVLLGQFNAQEQTERLYDQLSFDVYYHSSSDDWTAPALTDMSSGLAGSTITVTVNASDASGIEAVVIAYTDESGVWSSVNLEQSQGSWSGSFGGSADTEFFVQVVDQAGNVAVRDNNGMYFKPGEDLSFSIYLPLVVRNG